MRTVYVSTSRLPALWLPIAFIMSMMFVTTPPCAGLNEWELARVRGIEAVKKSLEPLPPSVKRYNTLLSGLDTEKIRSIVTALDAYKERFLNAAQEERDKAFVLFYLAYLQTAEDSIELDCNGLDESPDHIPNLRKIAEQAGLEVFDECGYNFWGPKQYFLLDTFQPYVSPSLVEFLKLKAMDLQFGFTCDGSLTIRFPELGERCVRWETYVHGFPNSLMRVVARSHYERDLQALILGAGQGDYPYDRQADVASTQIEREYLSVYHHILHAHPATPLADLLRKYLDLLSKSDTIEKEKREQFFDQYKALSESKIVCFPINYGETCREKISWDEVQRGCLGYRVPAVGVVDTESGKITRVKYSINGVAYPAKPYDREFVFPCVWSSTHFYTMIANGGGTGSTTSSETCQESVTWTVREFDGQANLVGTTPLRQTVKPEPFEGHYLYRPKEQYVLGPENDNLLLNSQHFTVVGGPTEKGVAMLQRETNTEEGWVAAYSFDSNSKQSLFHAPNLFHVGVSPDMRFVGAGLHVGKEKTCELHLIDVITGEDKLLENAGSHSCTGASAWSPDSKMMAYPLRERNDHEAICIYSVDTGALHKVMPTKCTTGGFIYEMYFLDTNRLLYKYENLKSKANEWIALEIATGKTLWTIRDCMEYVTVFDSGKKIACFFPEVQK